MRKVRLVSITIVILILSVQGCYPSRPDDSIKSSAVESILYPMDIINSHNWKLTLPVNNAQEIKVGGNPDLLTYSSEWFQLNPARNGVSFLARTDGATTSGSSNPRSELREMTNNGANQASWSSSSGRHTMTLLQSIDVLPIGSKPSVVAGQIHGSSDDISVFKIEGNKTGDRSIASIWITNGDTSHAKLLTSSYHLGDRFSVGFVIEDGKITYSFNGKVVPYSISKSFSGAYFKAGSYNQSGGNCTKLADGKCDYAQVTIFSVQVCHNDVCSGNSEAVTPTPMPTTAPTDTPTPSPTDTPTSTSPIPTPTVSIFETTVISRLDSIQKTLDDIEAKLDK